MYVTTRRYTNASALTDAMSNRTNEVEDLFRSAPGFIEYYALRSGDGGLTTVSVFENKEQADEGTRRAREWVQKNIQQGSVPQPDVSGGEVFISFGVERHAHV
jgi:heme-degrading monooxygenase HmoA